MRFSFAQLFVLLVAMGTIQGLPGWVPGWIDCYCVTVLYFGQIDAKAVGVHDTSDLVQESEDLQSLSFKQRGMASFGYDQAHLFILVNLSQVIEQYNHLIKNLDAGHQKMILDPVFHHEGVLKSHAVLANHTWTILHLETKSVAQDLEYLCSLLKQPCTVYDTTSTFRHPKTHEWMLRFEKDLSDAGVASMRTKRNIFADLGLAGISIYNLIETQRLSGQLQSVEHNQELIAAQVEHVRESLEQEQENVDKVVALANQLSDVTSKGMNLQLLLEILVLSRQQLSLIRLWSQDLINTLVSKRLMPSFFKPKSLSLAFKNITKQAEEHDLTPVLASTNLVDLPVSYVVNKDKVILMAHVHLARNHQYQLYERVDLPLRLRNGNLTRIVTHGKDFLAVSKDGTEYLSLTAHDLSTCDKQQDTFLCDIGLTNRATFPDCLFALFQGRKERVKELCDFTPVLHVPSITAVSKNQVYVLSHLEDEESTYALNCPSPRGVITRNVPARSTITVPSDCTFTSDRMLFRPNRRFDIRAGFHLTPFPTFDYDWEDLRLVATTQVNITHIKTEPLHLDPINDKGHMGLVIAILTAIAVGAVGIALFFTYNGLRTARKHVADHAAEIQRKIDEWTEMETFPPQATKAPPAQQQTLRILSARLPAVAYNPLQTSSEESEPGSDLDLMLSLPSPTRNYLG